MNKNKKVVCSKSKIVGTKKVRNVVQLQKKHQE